MGVPSPHGYVIHLHISVGCRAQLTDFKNDKSFLAPLPQKIIFLQNRIEKFQFNKEQHFLPMVKSKSTRCNNCNTITVNHSSVVCDYNGHVSFAVGSIHNICLFFHFEGECRKKEI